MSRNNNNNNTGSLTKPPPDSPAPRQRPRRELFENWSEYVDQTTGRPFYYNSENRAKSWKPPRRIGTSPITRVRFYFFFILFLDLIHKLKLCFCFLFGFLFVILGHFYWRREIQRRWSIIEQCRVSSLVHNEQPSISFGVGGGRGGACQKPHVIGRATRMGWIYRSVYGRSRLHQHPNRSKGIYIFSHFFHFPWRVSWWPKFAAHHHKLTFLPGWTLSREEFRCRLNFISYP
jgi:hypothetical protein